MGYLTPLPELSGLTARPHIRTVTVPRKLERTSSGVVPDRDGAALVWPHAEARQNVRPPIRRHPRKVLAGPTGTCPGRKPRRDDSQLVADATVKACGSVGGVYKNLYTHIVKDIVFVGGSGEDLRSFPLDARQRAGYQLYLVQMAQEPLDWKPMASVGPGCCEVRVRTAHDAYRVLYVASVSDAVYVLHCFQKKAHQTPKADIDLGRQRYRHMIELTRGGEAG